MNETMKEVATEALRRAIDTATATGEFLQEQAPLVVQELVRWQIVGNTALAALVVVVLIIWWWPGYIICKRLDPDGTSDFPTGPWAVFGGFGTLFGLPFALSCAYDALMWTLAPRVALIEYAANLVR